MSKIVQLEDLSPRWACCPWCSDWMFERMVYDQSSDKHLYYCECESCGMRTPKNTYQAARDAASLVLYNEIYEKTRFDTNATIRDRSKDRPEWILREVSIWEKFKRIIVGKR